MQQKGTMIKSQTEKLADICFASQGWMLHPKLQQLGAFDGRYLHGVVWGKCFQECRRITLMMAFWENIQSRGTAILDSSQRSKFAFVSR